MNHTQQALAEAAILCYPQPGAPPVLTTDANDIAIGAVLEAIGSNVPEPLSFYSRTLHKAERNYSTFDKELIAVHSASDISDIIMLEDSSIIQTDYRPLVTAFTKSGDAWSARQQQQFSAIAESSGAIIHSLLQKSSRRRTFTTCLLPTLQFLVHAPLKQKLFTISAAN